MESKIENLEANLFPTGYLVELAIQGVRMGLLETDSLEIAQRALKQPSTFISQSVLGQIISQGLSSS